MENGATEVLERVIHWIHGHWLMQGVPWQPEARSQMHFGYLYMIS